MAKNKVLVVDAHPDGIPNLKTGTFFTAVMHIFCGIVGAGVLALPRSVAWLGWVAGPIMIIIFWLISSLTSWLLADAYEVNGVENGRYHHAVRNILGPYYAIGVSVFQLANIFLINITYTITAATSMRAIAQLTCESNGTVDCFDSTWKMTLIFGAVEVALSQVPSLESAWWVSGLGVVTSVIYSTIALALGCKYAGARLGTVGGIPANNVNKAFGILNALGAIAFAYSFSLILLEIQDTLRQPPKASKTMKPASIAGITGSFAFYFTVAVVNYSAYGNDVSGFILNAYPGPHWLLIVGHVCIMLHMVSAYQVFGQPMFDTIESHIKAFTIRRARAAGDTEMPKKVEELKRASAARGTLPPSDSPAAEPTPPGAPPTARASAGGLRRTSAMVNERLNRMSQQASMYRVSTGFANETVPLNDEHFFIPFWQRLIVRTIYVCITTVVACVMPFFSDMAGLVGSLTFFPLSVFFPIRCWRALYHPTGKFSALLWVIEISMGLVCIAATIASVRGIILNWSSYKIFAD